MAKKVKETAEGSLEKKPARWTWLQGHAKFPTIGKDIDDAMDAIEKDKSDFEGRIVHAVHPNLSLGKIGDIEFKMPPKENLTLGMKEIEVLVEKKQRTNTQIRTLTQLRETLLPKLMSGEVRVSIS